jgi:hypothetical protein
MVHRTDEPYLVLLVWLAAALLAVAALKRGVPGAVEGFFSDGPPRWRAAMGIPTQFLFFPGLLLASALKCRGGGGWARQWSSGGAIDCAWAETFVLVFPVYMVLDFAIVEVRPLMAAHHVLCTVGHLVGCSHVFRKGLPHYFMAAVALEMGSGACNVFCLYPHQPAALTLYLIVMGMSNLLAVACLLRWANTLRPLGFGAYAVLLVSGALIAARQRVAHSAGSLVS